jgi:hypothetical protein
LFALIFALLLAADLAALWLCGVPNPFAVPTLVIALVLVPAAGLIFLRWQPDRWFNVGMLIGLAAVALPVMQASPGRHSTPDWFVPATLVFGALLGWPCGLLFRRFGRGWLTPLAADLVEPPVSVVVRLSYGAGRLTVNPNGLSCAVNPDNTWVRVTGGDAKGLFQWGEVARVESGTIGESGVRALRVVLVRGRQFVVPCPEAAAVAAFCTGRLSGPVRPRTGWVQVRRAFAELAVRHRRSNVRLPFLVALAVSGGFLAWRAVTDGGVMWGFWLVYGTLMLAGVVYGCVLVWRMVQELAELNTVARRPRPVPALVPPAGWLADPVATYSG